jgi:hypothetical protein
MKINPAIFVVVQNIIDQVYETGSILFVAGLQFEITSPTTFLLSVKGEYVKVCDITCLLLQRQATSANL